MRVHGMVLLGGRIGLLALMVAGIGGCRSAASAPSPTAIRVGYFPNITHSQALIGVGRGDFAEALGSSVHLETTVFNAGPSVIEAMFAGQIDLAYIGPNPAVNGYVKSDGEAVRVIAGATSGGAAFIVRADSGIRSASDLAGKRIATPQLGNTQDVALRAYLVANGLRPAEQGGTVQVIPTQNPEILDLFRRGDIDGAWVPEPWATRLIVEAGGELFLDERSLWPNGDFATALVIARTPFLEAHPEVVTTWLETHIALTLWAQANQDEAKSLANAQIELITTKALPQAVLDGAWSRQRLTYDPIASSVVQSAQAAYVAGFLEQEPDISGLFDLRLLNQVLVEQGLPTIQ